MRMQRMICMLTAIFLCLALLAGCSVEFSTEPGTTTEPASIHVPDVTKEPETTHESADQEIITEKPVFSDTAMASMDSLRREIGSNGARFGMAYIGYFDSTVANETEIDFGQWFYAATSALAANYPFVSEIDGAHTVGTEGHLYCMIAGDPESAVSVSRKGEDRPLYTSEGGDPLLVFCNLDGDAQTADTVVTIITADGAELCWEPTLDEMGFPDLLIGEERALLSWDFTPLPDTGFDLEGWLVNGWGGITAVGLAYDSMGTDWWIHTWDNSESYCLSFYLDESDGYDGKVVLECFYETDPTVQAKWEGAWRMETQMDQPSTLYLELALTAGADMAAFENASTVSGSYLTLTSQSGNELLLVADSAGTVLPIFPEGVQAVELSFADG